MPDTSVSERDQAEIERSAAEARKTVLTEIDRVELGRYLKPDRDSPYGLEYAFSLLGEIRGMKVLDLGCGTGGNVVPLIERGAVVVGIDISPELIELARQRSRNAGLEAQLKVASAYDTGLESGSVDIILCINLVHHLEIKRLRDEILRILVKGGVIILKEPVRFSRTYGFLRGLFPARKDISEFEHPMTRGEIATFTEPFEVQQTRYFRLPWVPLVSRILPSLLRTVWKADSWILRHCPATKHYATGLVMRLVKRDSWAALAARRTQP